MDPIERGSLVRLGNGKGLLVSVLHGELWITQEGDERDYCVGAGQSLRIERRGLVVASALRRSSIALSYGHARAPRLRGRFAALRRRLARAWAGVYAPFSRPTTAAL